MKTNIMVAGVVVVCLVGMAVAREFTDVRDEMPKHYLAKSDLVVSGHISSEPTEASSPVLDKAGTKIKWYMCKFAVEEVLYGDGEKDAVIEVIIQRMEIEESDRLPFIRKGGKCVLFLVKDNRVMERPDGTRLKMWKTADDWFGANFYQKSLAEAVKGLRKVK